MELVEDKYGVDVTVSSELNKNGNRIVEVTGDDDVDVQQAMQALTIEAGTMEADQSDDEEDDGTLYTCRHCNESMTMSKLSEHMYNHGRQKEMEELSQSIIATCPRTGCGFTGSLNELRTPGGHFEVCFPELFDPSSPLCQAILNGEEIDFSKL